MLRKIIFIGQAGGGTIYLNTKTNQILKRESSALLSMEGSRNNARYAAIGAAVIGPFVGLIAAILKQVISTENLTYTRPIFICLGLIWAIESVGLVLLLERALYGRKSDPFVPALSSEFGYAYRSNIIMNNPKGKKVTLKNKVGTLIFLLALEFCSLTMTSYMLLAVGSIFSTEIAGLLPDGLQLLDQPLEFSLFLRLLTFGVMPFVGYLLAFQNNPFRWLLAVEKYKTRKLRAKKVGD